MEQILIFCNNLTMSNYKQLIAERIKKNAVERKREMQLNECVRNQINSEHSSSNVNANPSINAIATATVQNNISNALTRDSKLQDQNKMDTNKQILQIHSFREAQLLRDPFVVKTSQPVENQEEIQRQIQEMVKQKQDKIIPDEQETHRQVMVNTLKNKAKSRGPKPMDPPTPFHLLSPPYQEMKIFASYLPIYEQRRRRQLYTRLVDLGVKNLQQVIFQCFQEGIILPELFKSISDRSVDAEIDFVKKFADNRLDEFDFISVKFTPLHYRLLGGILIQKNSKYIWGERIYCVFKQLTDFYEAMFKLSEDQYRRLCRHVRIKYNLFWLKELDWMEGRLDGRMDDEIECRFDNTSTIFQMRPSPTFGADLNDDQKQFYLSKKQKYPKSYEMFNTNTKKGQNQNKNQSGNKSEQSQSEESRSDYQSISDSNEDYDSQNFASSMLKSSKSRRGKSKSRSKSFSIDSYSDIRSSENISGISHASDESDMDHEQNMDEDSDSDSMYRSKSKSVSKMSSQLNSGRERIKNKKGEKNQRRNNKSQSNMSEEQDDNSQEIDAHNIFEDYEDDESEQPPKKKK